MKEEPMKLNVNPSLIQVKSPINFIKLSSNSGFCHNLLGQNSMTVLAIDDDNSQMNLEPNNLVYNLPQSQQLNEEALGAIMNLLTQLKAATDDQNVFVQNNTVVREQILNQLKSEILKSQNRLTKEQIKDLQVISSNNFDKDELTDILKSLLESSKKKSDEKNSLFYKVGSDSENSAPRVGSITDKYTKILKNVHHYTKIVDDVFSHVVHKKELHKEPLESKEKKVEKKNKQVATDKVKKTKKIKNISNELTKFLDSTSWDEIQESFEENVINRIGIISPIMRLQSKISEINILSNLSRFVDKIIEKSVPKAIRTNTKLINRVVDRSDIEELKQNVISHQEQYQFDKVSTKHNLDRIYSDIRKVYNSKNIHENVLEFLKSSKFKNVHFDETIKKSLLKVASRNEVVNKLKNIYEKQVQKKYLNRRIDKAELINKENVDTLNVEERSAVEDIVNVKRKSNQNLVDILKTTTLTSSDETLSKDIIRSSFRNDIINKAKNIYAKQLENTILNRRIDKAELINKENVETLNVEEKSAIEDIVNIKNKSNKNLFKALKTTVHTDVEEIINKDIFKSSLSNDIINRTKNIYEKQLQKTILNRVVDKAVLVNKENTEVLDTEEKTALKDIVNIKRSGKKIDSHLSEVTKIKNKIIENTEFDVARYKKMVHNLDLISKEAYNREDVFRNYFNISTFKKHGKDIYTNKYEFKPMYLKERLFDYETVENIVSKNVSKILSPITSHSKSISTNTKNIYKDIVTSRFNHYVENQRNNELQFLIHKADDVHEERVIKNTSQYMVYKEEPKVLETKVINKSDSKKEEKPKIIEKYENPKFKDVGEPKPIDTRKLTNDIIAKTLKKKDVEAIVEAYIRNINFDGLSKRILNELEYKMSWNKKRNGIF